MQWIRLEERYRRKIKNTDELGGGYNFNFVARYNIPVAFRLVKRHLQKTRLSVSLNDEIHVNFGKQIVYNYFDQNRFFAGFAYHLNAKDYMQFGYMNVFQQLAAGNKYSSLHAARIFYFHNIDLRRIKIKILKIKQIENRNPRSVQAIDTNNLFPVFLKLEEMNVLLVGAGNVGIEKLACHSLQCTPTQVQGGGHRG